MEGRRVKLTKLTDNKFEGNHPNGINQGYEKIGFSRGVPTKGEAFFVTRGVDNFFHTPTVTEEMNEEGIFKTMNSTYKLEYLD